MARLAAAGMKEHRLLVGNIPGAIFAAHHGLLLLYLRMCVGLLLGN
jgi:hypothetical protein